MPQAQRLQQEVAKFGHDMIWNRQQSVDLIVQDQYWSLVELVFSGPPQQTVTVDQWIQTPEGKSSAGAKRRLRTAATGIAT